MFGRCGGKRGTMLKRKTVSICVVLVCVCLCACSKGTDEIILIGSESETVAMQTTGLPEKNRRKPVVSSGQEDAAWKDVQEQVMIRVHVCGAVVQPGVVELEAGSRVEDALASCGGFAQGADRTYVNLAAWAVDGEMIYFPTLEEVQTGLVWQREQRSHKESGTDAEGNDLVNINTADVALLCTLPGIGESRAEDIIAYRDANGPFRSCDAIMSVPGIKAGIYEEICNRITVD